MIVVKNDCPTNAEEQTIIDITIEGVKRSGLGEEGQNRKLMKREIRDLPWDLIWAWST